MINVGKYPIDSSKTVWVIETDLGEEVLKFHARHLAGRSESEQRRAPYNELRNSVFPKLRERFRVCGRLSHLQSMMLI